MTDFDAVRAAHPELIVNLYAMTPGGTVTLEIIDPTGTAWMWTDVTAAGCIAQAFPAAEPVAGVEEPPTPEASIFD